MNSYIEGCAPPRGEKKRRGSPSRGIYPLGAKKHFFVYGRPPPKKHKKLLHEGFPLKFFSGVALFLGGIYPPKFPPKAVSGKKILDSPRCNLDLFLNFGLRLIYLNFWDFAKALWVKNSPSGYGYPSFGNWLPF